MLLSSRSEFDQPDSQCSGRNRANSVYLKYLTSKTQARFAPSRLRDREASFRRVFLNNSPWTGAGCDCSIPRVHCDEPCGWSRSLAVLRKSQQKNGPPDCPNDRSSIMSGVNGDKSRFNRVRKQKLARRIRNRQLFKNAAPQAKPA